MSTNILKKLVEQFAPETVKNEIARCESAHAVEREARTERLCIEASLLESIERANARKAKCPEPISCLS